MEDNSKKQRKARTSKDTAIITGNPNDIVVVSPPDNPKKFQTEQSIQERVVGLLQRRKRAIQMRRSENKLQRRREMLKTRFASKEKLMQRAMRMAKQLLRSRVAGKNIAKKYNTLNVAQKISIDKMVDSKSKLIKKIAARLLPRMQAGERGRLKAVLGGRSTKGMYDIQGINAGDNILFTSKFLGEVSSKDINQFFNMYEASIGKNLISIAASPIRAAGMIGKAAVKTAGVAALMSTPSTAVTATTAGIYSASKKLADVGKPDTTTKKTKINASFEWSSDDYLFEKACCCLRKKAEKYETDYETVKEVFENGLTDYSHDDNNTPYQFAMQRVNSFLANEAKERPGLWANIHAKRARIKAGSGERMRKPGSEGAPTKQNFIDAAEEVKKTPHEKFKAGLKKAGYDPDAGAKRLLDLIAKQKKEREEFEKKYNSSKTTSQVAESFVVDRASGYSGVYTAKDLGIKMQGGFALHPSVTEEGGAGDEGTQKLTNKYKKDTPGQALEAISRQIRNKRKANTPC